MRLDEAVTVLLWVLGGWVLSSLLIAWGWYRFFREIRAWEDERIERWHNY